jgi:drug/metabolite transporter (DMT)-like permease
VSVHEWKITMSSSRFAAAGLGLALASAATFGVSGPFAKSLFEAGWSSGAALAVRVGGAAVVLLIPVLLALRGRWHLLKRSGGIVAVYGVIAIALCQFAFFNAVQRMDVGVALLLEYLAPVLIVGWLWLRSRRAPRILTAGGAVLAVAGLLLVLDLSGSARLDPVGVLWGLTAAVCLAVYFVLSARVDADLPPIVMTGGGMIVGAAVILVLGLAGVLPFRFTGADAVLAGWGTSWLVPALGLVLVSTVAAYFAGILAAQKLGSKLASFVALTEVMFAVLASWLMLGELPGTVQLLGGVLIVAGVVLVRLDELRATAPAPPPNPAKPQFLPEIPLKISKN